MKEYFLKPSTGTQKSFNNKEFELYKRRDKDES